MTDIEYRWHGEFTNGEVNALHADAFEHSLFDDDWLQLVANHSLGWVTARRDTRLVGFVNVIWDGQVHAWIQDTIVSPQEQRTGIGTRLVQQATKNARAADCEWLHVDFDDHLRDFYFDRCGFTTTGAGLIDLSAPAFDFDAAHSGHNYRGRAGCDTAVTSTG